MESLLIGPVRDVWVVGKLIAGRLIGEPKDASPLNKFLALAHLTMGLIVTIMLNTQTNTLQLIY